MSRLYFQVQISIWKSRAGNQLKMSQTYNNEPVINFLTMRTFILQIHYIYHNALHCLHQYTCKLPLAFPCCSTHGLHQELHPHLYRYRERMTSTTTGHVYTDTAVPLSGHSLQRPPPLMWPQPQIFATTVNAFVSLSNQRPPL